MNIKLFRDVWEKFESATFSYRSSQPKNSTRTTDTLRNSLNYSQLQSKILVVFYAIILTASMKAGVLALMLHINATVLLVLLLMIAQSTLTSVKKTSARIILLV